jgi:DnaJ family protein C protein 17
MSRASQPSRGRDTTLHAQAIWVLRAEPLAAIALIVTIRSAYITASSIQYALHHTNIATSAFIMANDDLKQHINSSHDFYALLSIPNAASEAEIRSGWRKTALKHHPDKVGATPETLEKFHLLQIAFDVLSDESTKALYDNARRALEQKAQRTSAYDEKRKAMIEKLEKGERDAKRKRGELDEEEDKFQKELARLAADGKRRREARTEMWRQEALEEERKWAESQAPPAPAPVSNAADQDKEKSVTFRFRRDEKTAHLDRDAVQALFSHFGAIEHLLLRDKKRKIDGEKHKILYCSGLVVFKNIFGALAAVHDFPKLKEKDARYAIFEEVDWADRPKPNGAKIDSSSGPSAVPATPEAGKVPKFFSFKGSSAKKSETRSEEETARLRTIEIERIRREDEESDAVNA